MIEPRDPRLAFCLRFLGHEDEIETSTETTRDHAAAAPPSDVPQPARQPSTSRLAARRPVRGHRRRGARLHRRQSECRQSQHGRLGAALDELGRDHGARTDAGDRGRRDRPVLRRHLRPRDQRAGSGVDRLWRSGLSGDPACHRRRRPGRPVQRRSGDEAQDTVLHRHARQLQSALRHNALGHRTPPPSIPTYPPPGKTRADRANSISSSV